jgi:hypothetical protein
VKISGSGFASGETVKLTIEHAFDFHQDEFLYATTDDLGDFENIEYLIKEDEIFEFFTLTAFGLTSEKTASTTFTDGPNDWIWDGGGTDNNWNTKDNWDKNTVPSTGKNLEFGGNNRTTTNNNITTSPFSAAKITFNNTASAFVLSGNDIYFSWRS